MYNIVICDDDKGYIDELRKIIESVNQYNRKLHFFEFYSGEDLLNKMPFDIDILFLDIQLGGRNGNEIALELYNRGFRGVLVQVSGIYMPTPETIRISPYRYILKNDFQEQIIQDIEAAFEEADRQKTSIAIEASYLREPVIITIRDITYFTHHRKGSVVHLSKSSHYASKIIDGQLITQYTFSELLEMLHPVGFALPHNSYIVNMRYIKECRFKNLEICIEDEAASFSIARNKKEEFKSDFLHFLNKKYKEKLF